jgi:hypothetical protein
MKKLGELYFQDGWMGGAWKLKRERDTIDNFSLLDRASIEINNVLIPVRRIEIIGDDYDQGHSYSWRASDYEFKLETPIGKIKCSLRRFFAERRNLKSVGLFK